MRIVKIVFVGFLVSFLLTGLLSQSVWLEMRIHVGNLLPWLALPFIFRGLRKNAQPSFAAVLLLQGTLLLTFLVIYRFQWDALAAIPATLMREALYRTGLSLERANAVLVLILAAGNLSWVNERVWRAVVPAGNGKQKGSTGSP
ncbi:MAG: hypothetical protein P4L43_00810 [Syntrophobacteraceae bacterium]|nr:hypothetical protein [Syntrophobacteraceae bacterium]